MRGYHTRYGYKGYIPSLKQFILFASEDEYKEMFSVYEKINRKQNSKYVKHF